jgi:demethylmenaquinone methyltransferase / 2-methoxy-6-polyprenyl-1,4-benzoquinol methylase
MFTHIAQRYDWFDHVASMGNDFLWRPRALWDLDRYRRHRPVRRVLDVGCGTGDLTRLATRHYPDAEVIGVDFTRAMLRRAQQHRLPGRVRSRVHLGEADATRLPFRDGSFDVVMSAFVVRNLPRLGPAYRELHRVLVPGGTVLALEITTPLSPRFSRLFHRYFDTVVPWLGSLVASAGPYRYLPDSLHALPDRDGMMSLLRASGFSEVVARPQSLGIVTSYLGHVADGTTPRAGVIPQRVPAHLRHR